MGTSSVSVILVPSLRPARPARSDACGAPLLPSLHRQRPLSSEIQVLAPLRSEPLATNATGELLVFLGRGLDASPVLVAAHVAAHIPDADRVVIGYVTPARPGRTDFVAIERRAWWEDHFYAMRRPGHRFAYDDLAGVNFSLPAALFQRLGGFDPTLADPLAQVLDLGVRALAAGARFVYAGQAVAYQWAAPRLPEVLAQDRRHGRVDATIAGRHRAFRGRPVVEAAAGDGGARPLPAASRFTPDVLFAGLRPMLALAERLRLRRRWRRLYAALRVHAYWLGWHEGEQAGEIAVWRVPATTDARSVAAPQGIDLDLQRGLAVAEHSLDAWCPASVRLLLGRQCVGDIPARPGAEPLRGVHLRPALATILAAPLAQVLQQGGLDGRLDGQVHVQPDDPWFEPVEPLHLSPAFVALLRDLLS